MRKNTLVSVLTTAFLLIIIIIACKKTDRVISTDNITQEMNDYRFLKNRLRQFANEFIPVLANASARNFIVDKAKMKFDEEYEVLINDLFRYSEINSLVPVSINKRLHEDIYKRSGEFLYPQIYIPRLQYLEDNNIAENSIGTEAAEDTIYVFYSGDPEVDSAKGDEIYPGYKLIDGQFEYFTMVDEDYANEHEVWVFSLNESVNPLGLMPTPCEIDPCAPGCPIEGCEGGPGGGDPGGSPDDDPTDAPAPRNDFPDMGHNKINFRIQNMKVTIHNESWLSGASEVSIRAKLVCHNGRNLGIPGSFPDEYSSDQYSNHLGKLIKKMKRKDIKDEVWQMNINYSMQTNWQNEVPIQDPVHFIYTIFERDKWPAYLNTDALSGFGQRYALNSLITNEPAPAQGFKLYYRSNDKNTGNYPYAKSHFTNTLTLATADKYAGTGLVESSSGGIYFNTVLY